MSGSITLHSKLGINPRLVKVHCFACGQVKDDSIALLGSANKKSKCPGCNTWIIGGVRISDKCPKCGQLRESGNWETVELSDWESIEHNGICQECQGYMKQGIILISASNETEGDANPYRTGGWVVIKEEALRRLVKPVELADQIIKKRMCFVPDSVWDKIGLPRGEVRPAIKVTDGLKEVKKRGRKKGKRPRKHV